VAEPEAHGRATALLRRVYGLFYAPQDRLAEAIVARRPALTSPLAVSLLANLGMSTQLAALGLLVAVGHPLAFAWVALAEVAVIALALLPRRAPSRQEEVA
jgi:heme A synthase